MVDRGPGSGRRRASSAPPPNDRKLNSSAVRPSVAPRCSSFTAVRRFKPSGWRSACR
jgi:hypothetical protein